MERRINFYKLIPLYGGILTELQSELLLNYLWTDAVQQWTTLEVCSSLSSSLEHPPDMGQQSNLRSENPNMAGMEGEWTTELQEEEHMGIN